jgi:hypothetical protein
MLYKYFEVLRSTCISVQYYSELWEVCIAEEVDGSLNEDYKQFFDIRDRKAKKYFDVDCNHIFIMYFSSQIASIRDTMNHKTFNPNEDYKQKFLHQG